MGVSRFLWSHFFSDWFVVVSDFEKNTSHTAHHQFNPSSFLKKFSGSRVNIPFAIADFQIEDSIGRSIMCFLICSKHPNFGFKLYGKSL